jgi:hypothetical protein
MIALHCRGPHKAIRSMDGCRRREEGGGDMGDVGGGGGGNGGGCGGVSNMVMVA